MIAAMNLHRHRQIHGLGQDQTDLPIDTIDVPVTEPVLEAPTNVSAPILFTPVAPSPVAIGPAVPSDFTPLTPAQLAALHKTVASGQPLPAAVIPIAHTAAAYKPLAATEQAQSIPISVPATAPDESKRPILVAAIVIGCAALLGGIYWATTRRATA